ncbi:glycosyltransferase family 4 protein [Bacillus sp. V3B]|uniref:glycosyltransferase family 4 protein n=1 Tax=Bacillus sp. V3B TaxID=2804915 RepID=UPI002109A85F|nr:glycosyltransferase family 4 protein [Bacillus sp. V3B]MCQ6275277.1 glycosyltransferase family 4 protein [Bacillus sp. V3B]
MQKRVLFCATVDYHFSSFHLPYMKWFKDQGWEVHVAAAGSMDLPFTDQKFDIPIARSPFNSRNIKAYAELKNIIDHNHYKIIHCHTPMGGVLARLAARRARKNGTKVIYTAHGFHFCKGAPLANWLLYYPIEKNLAKYTDCLITINTEDYQLAKKRFKVETIEHVHGVGVNTDTFKPIGEEQKQQLRQMYGYQKDDFILFYAAEFNRNKNQQLLLEALAIVKEEVPNARLLLAGKGPLQIECEKLAERLGIKEMVHFLGYRNDIETLLKISDAAVASSLREGLPVNMMEAMACGLPVIATDNRGHRELITNNKNGWIIDPQKVEEFAKKMKLLTMDTELKSILGNNGRKIMLSTYSTAKILDEKSHIYKAYMRETEGERWAVH